MEAHPGENNEGNAVLEEAPQDNTIRN